MWADIERRWTRHDWSSNSDLADWPWLRDSVSQAILCSNKVKKGKAASQVSYWFLLVFTGKRWTKSPVQPVSVGAAVLEETCPLRIGKWTPARVQNYIFQKDKDFLPMIPVIRDFAQESSNISKDPQLHKHVNFQCTAGTEMRKVACSSTSCKL